MEALATDLDRGDPFFLGADDAGPCTRVRAGPPERLRRVEGCLEGER